MKPDALAIETPAAQAHRWWGLGKGIAVLVMGTLALLITGVVTAVALAAASTPPTLPSSKAAALQQQQDDMAAARAHAAPKPLAASLQPRHSVAARQEGVVEMHQGPFPPFQFMVRNMWQGSAGPSGWLLVYAGAQRDDPTSAVGAGAAHGALRLYSIPPDPGQGDEITPLGVFVDPNGGAGLTVLSRSGSTLQLRTDDGRTVSFDLGKDEFVSS